MKKICILAIIVGIVLMLTGLYFSIIKAGIPYQDPTPEMVKEYARSQYIGLISFRCGLAIEILAGIGLVVTRILKKRNARG